MAAQVEAYRMCFEDACNNVDKLDAAIGKYYGQAAPIVPDESNLMLFNTSFMDNCTEKSFP